MKGLFKKDLLINDPIEMIYDPQRNDRRIKEEKDIRSTRELYENRKKKFSARVYEILRTPVAGEEGKK